jgi:hypothetical protein
MKPQMAAPPGARKSDDVSDDRDDDVEESCRIGGVTPTA